MASTDTPSVIEQFRAAKTIAAVRSKELHQRETVIAKEMDEITQKHKKEVDSLRGTYEAAEADMYRARRELIDHLMENGLIELLAPAHSRTSCSDTSPTNEARGCLRCRLLSYPTDLLSKATFEVYT